MSLAYRATSASCSTIRCSDENGPRSPTSLRRRSRYTRNIRSALRSSRPWTLMKRRRPSLASPKYGVELRASTPARDRCASGTPALAMASTTAGPRGRLLGAPKASSTAEPLTTPQPTASTRSVGTSPPPTARKTTPTGP